MIKRKHKNEKYIKPVKLYGGDPDFLIDVNDIALCDIQRYNDEYALKLIDGDHGDIGIEVDGRHLPIIDGIDVI